MIRIAADVGKNRIVFELVGQPTDADLALAEGELRAQLPRLRPPIDVLSDVTQLESLDAMTPAEFERVYLLVHNLGIRRLVRVVGRSKMGALHAQRMTPRRYQHSAHLAFSREEAESLLAQR